MDGVFLLLCAFIFGLLVGRRLRKQKYEEHIGEVIVNQTIQKHLSGSDFHLLKNITLPTRDGTTQIDHVLVSSKGIFVIETKYYTGWIFGNAQSKKWMQTTKFGSKNKFQNPLLQNYGHLKALKEMFPKLKSEMFKSIIVFSGDGEFKTKMPENVMHVDMLEKYITQFDESILSEAQCCWVIGRIELCRKEVSVETDKQHALYLNKMDVEEKTVLGPSPSPFP